jgi:anaerobic magnesium-protoporphyrin IX monomethyl ester cyclase
MKTIKHKAKIRKVMLIQPPAWCNNMRSDMNPNVPLGIAYIAATLIENGYEVTMLDAFIEGWDIETRLSPDRLRVGLPFEEIRDRIAAEAPDAVGITSMFTAQRKNMHKVAELVKDVDPNTVVVVGGAHPTSAPTSVLEDPNVDAIVLGEGDNSITSLLKTIESDGDLASLDGVGFCDDDGQMVIQDKTQQIEDLDTLPFPARHLLPMEKYFNAGVRHGGPNKGNRAASLITSRGCQYRCNFCTAFKVFTRRPRMRSTENVMAELEELVNTYKVDEIFFEDDQLIAKQRHSGEIFDAIAENFNFVWDTPNGVSAWLLNDEIIGKMKASGCYRINLAIESGNQDVLKNIINKPVKLDHIPGLVKLIKKHGMEPTIFLVAGNIARDRVETLDEIRDSFRFARRIGVNPFVSYLTAYPGSEVLDIAEEKGYLVPGFDWDNLMINKQQLQTSEWTPEQLQAVVERERTKTRLYIWLMSPGKLLARLVRNPFLVIRSIFRVLGQTLRVFFSGTKLKSS